MRLSYETNFIKNIQENKLNLSTNHRSKRQMKQAIEKHANIRPVRLSFISHNKSVISDFTKLGLDRQRLMTQHKYKHSLSSEESALVYYLANLILQDQYSLVDSLVKKYYLKMKKSSEVFRGNVCRFRALSLFQMLQMQTDTRNLTNINRKI